MRVKVIGLVIAGAAALLTGCSHRLEVKNLRSYQNMSLNPLEKACVIGIVPSTEDIHSQKLIKGVGTALGKYSATVVLPYAVGSTIRPDVIAKISVRPEYKGSGWNFLINWPGFLIFTPAWHGYIYKANYEFELLLTKWSDNTRIDSWTMPVKLDLRHAAIDRTWTEIGWLEWGVIPLIGGIVFTRYDHDVTPLVAEKIEVPIGDYIAQEIVNRINNYGELGYIRRLEAPLHIALVHTK